MSPTRPFGFRVMAESLQLHFQGQPTPPLIALSKTVKADTSSYEPVRQPQTAAARFAYQARAIRPVREPIFRNLQNHRGHEREIA